MKEAAEAAKAAKRTEISSFPETQFSLMRFSPHTKPFAEDNPGVPMSASGASALIGDGVIESWGGLPSQARVGLLPTGFASNHPAHTRTLTKEPNAAPGSGLEFLPERFQRFALN